MEQGIEKTGGSVVVIDRDELFVRLITTMFQNRGWKTKGYTTSSAALQALQENAMEPPDLLIADHSAPGGAVQSLLDKARQRYPGLYCLLLSGNRKVLPLLLPENTAFIHKPVRPSHLLQVAEKLLHPRKPISD